ncbi:MAG: hypothetical protein HUJ69_06020 [Lachnospiraceae bacterium]|nr:hypothetical protein [Lachnospiraceae bacterium]
MKKETVFYCQLDYEHVPYVSPTSPHGTIANSGCGPCCAAMLVENLLEQPCTPEEMAVLGKACGAREGYGTNLFIFSPVFAEKFGLKLTVTENGDEALAFLQQGRGMVIANINGFPREDGYIACFSDGGHYVLLIGAYTPEDPEEEATVKVLDPMYIPGRYDVPGRQGKVTMDGKVACTSMEVIRKDCLDRSYFLFEKIEE